MVGDDLRATFHRCIHPRKSTQERQVSVVSFGERGERVAWEVF